MKKPKKRCDIVMKGGVTSGIVYPLAVCELAKEYRFVSIGGTSAGAIAASLTAAAEYRRRDGSIAGFETLKNLPRDLAAVGPDGKSTLYSLFQPDQETKPLFEAMMGFTLKSQRVKAALGILRAVALLAPMATALSVLAFVVLLVLVAILSKSVSALVTVMAIIVFLVVALTLLVVVGRSLVKRAAARVAANGYGLCSGHGNPSSQSIVKPLTDWLADLIDHVAGKTDPEAPLTFADLWGRPSADFMPNTGRSINLQMMTTNLTHGRPYQLPFDVETFYFSPEDFYRFFPSRIVEWMVKNSRPADQPPFRHFPSPGKVPVIVAARMSLSFPFLISAIPLYAVDYHQKQDPQPGKPTQTPFTPERCWFSDGGICSNFPVHFFDAPLPRWPTFAINLRPFTGGYQPSANEDENVWMPRTPGDGTLEQWYRFEKPDPVGSVSGFFGAILQTMQNWTDNTQLKVPGYRDRVAHVFLGDDEGGMNLNMSEPIIERISARGLAAGELLRRRFDGEDPNSTMDWNTHRWIRYRTALGLSENYLERLTRTYESPAHEWEFTYPAMVRGAGKAAPKNYALTKAQRLFAARMTDHLCDLMKSWRLSKQTFERGAPKPVPEIRIRPRL